jgi:hypothetical protein
MGHAAEVLYERMLMPGQLFRNGLARNSLVRLCFADDTGFDISSYLRSPGLCAGF